MINATAPTIEVTGKPIVRCLACRTITFPDGRKLKAEEYDLAKLNAWPGKVTDKMALSRTCYDQAINVWQMPANPNIRASYEFEHC